MELSDLRLAHIHDEGKDYPVRVCMRVADAIVHTPSSIIDKCMECDAPIWVDPHMALPQPPPGMVLEEEVRMCIQCVGIHAMVAKTPPVFLPQKDLDAGSD